MRLAAFFLLNFVAITAWTQPKMHVMAYGGITGNRFIYKDKQITSDFLPGWEAGLGFRLRQNRLFGEFDISFINYGVSLPLEVNSDTVGVNARLRALEFPITAGYVPLATPLVKAYVYTGMVHRFNVSERLRIDAFGIDERLKPSDFNLPVYHLMWRFGVAADVAMLHFNLSWSVGVTNALRESIRTNHHVLRFTSGLRF